MANFSVRVIDECTGGDYYVYRGNDEEFARATYSDLMQAYIYNNGDFPEIFKDGEAFFPNKGE